MKKTASFLIDKRFWILGLMLIITAACAFLAPKVEINSDMTKYLSGSSNMKQGLDIMRSEFGDEEEDYSIRVMFEGLSDEEKASMSGRLENIEYVDSVDYDAGSADYNRGEHTLYVLHTEYEYGSEQEAAVEAALSADFAEHGMKFANNDNLENSVPDWLLMTAFAILLVILFIMCASWIEPLLFLSVTGAAVVMNLGTNIILGHVAGLTASVGPILQLILSMDYSIILLNRYRQARAYEPDRKKAMKDALSKSFAPIASSALTTVVGLAVLVLLDFKMGPEIGIVLAKGVFLSMVCVFTMLPALILAFSDLIKKTEKKTFRPQMRWLAGFSYKARYVIPFVFLAVFVCVSFLQNRTPVTFTVDRADPLAGIFPKDNATVLVYENSDEAGIDSIISELGEGGHIRAVAGYTNTVGKEYTASGMAGAIKDAGNEFSLDPAVISAVYYDRFGSGLPSLTVSEFAGFLTRQAGGNGAFSEYLDPQTAERAAELEKFTDPAGLTRPMSAAELADFLGIAEDRVRLALVAYYADDSGYRPPEMTLPQFIGFMRNDVVNDPDFSERMDPGAARQLDELAAFADPDAIQAQLPPAALAGALGTDESLMQQIFMLRYGRDISGKTMSVYEAAGMMLQDQRIASALAPEQAARLQTAYGVMTAVVSGAGFGYEQMAGFTGLGAGECRLLYTYKASLDGEPMKLSARDFAAYIAGGGFEEVPQEEAAAARELIDAAVSGEKCTAERMAELLGKYGGDVSGEDVELLYTCWASQNAADPDWKMSLREFVSYVSLDMAGDPRFSKFFDGELVRSAEDARTDAEEASGKLRGEKYSRLFIVTDYPEESEETSRFMDRLTELREKYLSGSSYSVGASAMVYEMENTFDGEYTKISLITVAAIFFVVMLTFRSPAIPLLLVLMVQGGVFVTVSAIGLSGGDVYYLALLIVQSILMGATIDYAIVLTGYYREARAEMDIREALAAAYRNSMYTITTSGSILIIVTFILGLFTTMMTSEVLQTISIGSLCSVVLILFVLPSILALSDRLVVRRAGKGGADHGQAKKDAGRN